MDTAIKPPALLSLCTGMRGLEEGIRKSLEFLRALHRSEQGWRPGSVFEVAAYVEIEAFVALNLVKQMEQGVLAPAPLFTDLKIFPWELFRNKICILTGGYPCQPFSQAGKQGGVLDPRHLFPFIERGIDAVKPVLCYFENVANHLNIGYEEVRGRLQGLGYTVEEGIFSANQVGAPHLRKRLFIMAVANSYCTEQSKRRGDLAKVLGLQEAECQPKFCSVVSGRDGDEVGNTKGSNEQRAWPNENQHFSDQGSSEVLGNADGPGSQGPDRVQESAMPPQSGESLDDPLSGSNSTENEVPAGRHRLTSSGPRLDNAIIPRLQRYLRDGTSKTRWQEQVRSIATASVWPAAPGPEQFEWEEPRIKSGMGYTIDGYDFTEDLLRMAGNAVVEQQSQIAFTTLLSRFL